MLQLLQLLRMSRIEMTGDGVAFDARGNLLRIGIEYR
jgi:hypothetical protein